MRRLCAAALIVAIFKCVPGVAASTARPGEPEEDRSSSEPEAPGTMELTLEDTFALARERAPAVLAARAVIEEARGRLVAASVLLRENPEVDVAAGTRSGVTGDSAEREFAIHQRLGTGGRRGARREGAEAGVVRAAAAADEAVRRAQREAGAAFLRVLHAEGRRRLAADSETIAAEILRVAERRHAAGEVAILDVNLARLVLARTRSDVAEAEAGRAAALGDLRAVLGLGPTASVTMRGTLTTVTHEHDEAALLARALTRPDLRSLEADLRAAEAEVRLGKALAWPEVGVGARYEREEGDDIWLGGLTFTLPVFERGQGVQAEAQARATRVRIELDAARRAVTAEVHAAFEAWARRAEAVELLGEEALPAAADNESLGRRSYDAGQIGLVEFLLVRRATLEAREVHLDRLLGAALASIDLELEAGVIP